MSSQLAVVAAALVLVALVIIAWFGWRRPKDKDETTTLVSDLAEGASVTMKCPHVEVLSAFYSAPGGGRADVATKLSKILNGPGGPSYTVVASALGQPGGGSLTFRYRCSTKDRFRPVPVSTCGRPRDPEYAVDMTRRGAAGTVVWYPWSRESKVSLRRAAESNEAAESLNPFTGVGKTSSVRTMRDRYRRGEALSRISQYELQPGEPGFMEEAPADGEMSLLRTLVGRPPANAAGAGTRPLCYVGAVDGDTAEFLTDGFYDEAVLQESRQTPVKEGLTSRRAAAAANTLTATKTGLGSTRRDPRFEPETPERVPGGDSQWAHGGHAGGPTFGAYAPAVFAPQPAWDSTYVYGFGDFGAAVPEVLETSPQ
jgi:hypothetical protein